MAKPLVVGQGPVRVIALHGWFGSSGAWDGFASVVDKRSFTYVFPDYRGYGARKHESAACGFGVSPERKMTTG